MPGVGRLAWRRLTAWVVDWCVVLAWVAVTAAIGVPLYAAGVTASMGAVGLNVLSAAVVEAHTGGPVTLGRAILRNALKVGLPWTIGHIAVIALVNGSAGGSVATPVWIVTVLAYVLPLIYVGSLLVGDGRTPYDRVAGTRVVAVG